MADMTLEEALAAADVSTTPVNDILMIDPESRTIIVPASEMLFGVRQDMDAERKHFKCPKIVGDNIDLSQCHIYISYVPSKQDGTYDINDDVGGYWCEDLAVDGDYITFSWKLSGNVFVKAGYIAFAVYAKQEDADGNMQTKWHTTFAIGKVLDTLPDGEQIAEKYADVIEQLLNKMENVEKVATPEAMKGYVEEFLNENPPSGMTDEEREQLNKNTEDISSLSEDMNDLDGLTYGIYVGSTPPTNGVMYWLDTSGDSTGGEAEVTLSSISATYSGGEVTVGTASTSLTGITVTAKYSDGTSKTVTDYTLSGTIAEGENTITVSYCGKTTTIKVTGVAESTGFVYDPTKWKSGRLSNTDGSVVDADTFFKEYYDEYIDISDGKAVIVTSKHTSQMIFRAYAYTSDKTYIVYREFSVPSNGSYNASQLTFNNGTLLRLVSKVTGNSELIAGIEVS